jgi:hypothetical protein
MNNKRKMKKKIKDKKKRLKKKKKKMSSHYLKELFCKLLIIIRQLNKIITIRIYPCWS